MIFKFKNNITNTKLFDKFNICKGLNNTDQKLIKLLNEAIKKPTHLYLKSKKGINISNVKSSSIEFNNLMMISKISLINNSDYAKIIFKLNVSFDKQHNPINYQIMIHNIKTLNKNDALNKLNNPVQIKEFKLETSKKDKNTNIDDLNKLISIINLSISKIKSDDKLKKLLGISVDKPVETKTKKQPNKNKEQEILLEQGGIKIQYEPEPEVQDEIETINNNDPLTKTLKSLNKNLDFNKDLFLLEKKIKEIDTLIRPLHIKCDEYASNVAVRLRKEIERFITYKTGKRSDKEFTKLVDSLKLKKSESDILKNVREETNQLVHYNQYTIKELISKIKQLHKHEKEIQKIIKKYS